MKSICQKSALLIVLAGIAMGGFIPEEAFAQAAPPDPCKTGTFGCFEVLNQLPGLNQFKTIDQAASQEDSIITVMNIVIKIVRGVVIAIGLIVVVLGGYRYMTAGGDGGKVTDAKKWILAGLGGILLAILGQVLLDTISPQFSGKLTVPKKLELPAVAPAPAPAPPPAQPPPPAPDPPHVPPRHPRK